MKTSKKQKVLKALEKVGDLLQKCGGQGGTPGPCPTGKKPPKGEGARSSLSKMDREQIRRHLDARYILTGPKEFKAVLGGHIQKAGLKNLVDAKGREEVSDLTGSHIMEGSSAHLHSSLIEGGWKHLSKADSGGTAHYSKGNRILQVTKKTGLPTHRDGVEKKVDGVYLGLHTKKGAEHRDDMPSGGLRGPDEFVSRIGG